LPGSKILSLGALKGNIDHEQDRFVWSPIFTRWSLLNIIRVSYYMSVVGDANRVREIEDRIASLSYTCSDGISEGSASVVPRAFKKASRERRSRLADIQITSDILKASWNTSVDSIMLASGDGDFLPLQQEVMRTGKQVYLAAFSSGLTPKLGSNADVFVDLDKLFFL
jgi:uncharacterized LabA/DUF88 family protein